MTKVVLLTLALVVELSLCQIHIGPIIPLDCHDCDKDHNTFPSCTDHIVTCGDDQVCQVSYGFGTPLTQCRNKVDCQNDTQTYLHLCQGGGVEATENHCIKCCQDSACVDDMMSLLMLEFPENANLMCPGKCDDTNIQACINASKLCKEGEYCEVLKDQGHVTGKCQALNHYLECLNHLVDQPCNALVGQGSTDHNCYWDCCTTNECLQSHFRV